MAGSLNLFWIITTAFLCLPRGSRSLLSDYKICGDPACESLMSRVLALKDHQNQDCRFLSFRKGDTIFVYHKLTGRREDLWAGTIDKKFGYFPKELVQEEQAYAVMEKIMETRKEDFFCMDEFGYPVDSSHLDDDYVQINEKTQSLESEAKTPPPEGIKIENPLRSTDPSPDSFASKMEEQAAQDKNMKDTTEDVTEESVRLNDQKSLVSSTWLSSSVTGWLGLTQEDQHSVKAEEEKKDDENQILSQMSYASSFKGWLNLGGDGGSENINERTEHKEIHPSSASTNTTQLEPELGSRDFESTNKEGEQQEETYQSLDPELSQSKAEDKNVIADDQFSDLGSEDKIVREEEKREESQTSSWFQMGIRMLNLNKDDVNVEEKSSTGSIVEEMKESKQETEAVKPEITQLKPELTNDLTMLVSNIQIAEDYEKERESIDVIRPADIRAEDHPRLEPVSDKDKDPKEGPSVESVGSTNSSNQNADFSLDPNTQKDVEDTSNDEEKQDLSCKTNTEGHVDDKITEFSEPNLSDEFQNSALVNQNVEQSQDASFSEEEVFIINETNNDTSDISVEINNIQGIETSPKDKDEREVVQPEYSSAQKSEEMMGELKVLDEQKLINMEKKPFENLEEMDEVLEEHPPKETELKKENEEIKLDIVELEGLKIKQEEVVKLHEKANLENLPEKEPEEEIKIGFESQKNGVGTEEIKQDKERMDLEIAPNLDKGDEGGKEIYNDLSSLEFDVEVRQERSLEGSLTEDDGSRSKELLSETRDVPDRTHEKIMEHTGEGETLSQEEDVSESHDIDSEAKLASAESSPPPRDPSSERLVGGTFVFLKNALGLFNQAPNSETRDSPQTQTSAENTGETLPMKTSSTHQNGLESMANSASNEHTEPESPNIQPQLYLSTLETSLDGASHNLEEIIQINSLSNNYPNVLAHVSLEDISVVMDKLGQHRLKTLDLIMSNLNNPDGDPTVVSDMIRLLQYHIETLLLPTVGVGSGLTEDKERTKTIIVLQKLEMLLQDIRKSFTMGEVELQDLQGQPRDEEFDTNTLKMQDPPLGFSKKTLNDMLK